MSDGLVIPPTMQPVEPARRSRGRTALWYGILFVAVQFLVVVVFFLIGTTSWFRFHDDYPQLLNIGYGSRVQGLDCDIVLYGDSTPLSGLDPAIIQAKTGLKTCNICEGNPTRAIAGSDVPLDLYLAHNKRPKYLLTMWVAPNFVPPPDSMATYKPEGVIYAFEFVRGPSLWKHMLLKPTWSFNYSAWVAHQLAIDAFQQSTGTYAQRWKGDLLETRNSHMGMWPLPLPPETHCVRPDPITGMRDHSQNAANEADFLRRYAVDGTRVIVDISPAADCDQNRFQYIQLTQGLTDNTLEFLPIENFNEGDIHYSPAGSKLISEQAADQLLSIIRQDSHQSPSDPSDLDQTSPRRSPAR